MQVVDHPGVGLMLAAGGAVAAARAVEAHLPGAQDYLTSMGVVPGWEPWVAAGATAAGALGMLIFKSPRHRWAGNTIILIGWSACVLLHWSAVGIVLDLFRVFFWVTGIPAGEFALVDWPGFLTRATSFAAMIIATRTILICQRASRGACLRCGRDANSPDIAPRVWVGISACGLAIIYPGVKYYWWLGGQFGRPAIYTEGFPAMETALLIGASALALALVRPWGRVIPRPILIMAGWGLSVALILQGTTTVFGLLGRLLGGRSLPIDGSANSWVILIVYASWTLLGLALLVATRAYQQRTRPGCPTCPVGPRDLPAARQRSTPPAR